MTSEPQSHHVDKECTSPSAAMLFKVLMNHAPVDNRTMTIMYHNLAALEVYIGVLNSNIEFFNRYVMDNRVTLKNWGHEVDEDDMLKCILNAYLLAQDIKFHAYITQIKTGIDHQAAHEQSLKLLQG